MLDNKGNSAPNSNYEKVENAEPNNPPEENSDDEIKVENIPF